MNVSIPVVTLRNQSYYGSSVSSPTNRVQRSRSPSYQKRRQQLLGETSPKKQTRHHGTHGPPGKASEVIPNKLYFVLVASHPHDTARSHYFEIDSTLVYEPFFLDFGPLHIGHVKRFVDLVDAKLNDPLLANKVLYYYSMFDDRKAATNAACMIALYALLKLKQTSAQVLAMVQNWAHCFMFFKDASPNHNTFDITVADVVRGVERAVHNGWLYIDSFDVDAYEYYEQLVNGDWNWIIPGKFLAFSGPNGPHTTFTSQQYVELFKRLGVTTVVRLNKKMYSSTVFTLAGFEHHDLFFSDGTTPPQDITDKFMKVSEGKACVAVHCKAGLGRTGTLIALCMMKDYKFTAREAMGWIRLCRPGSIIGQQQEFLAEVERTGVYSRGPAVQENVGGVPEQNWNQYQHQHQHQQQPQPQLQHHQQHLMQSNHHVYEHALQPPHLDPLRSQETPYHQPQYGQHVHQYPPVSQQYAGATRVNTSEHFVDPLLLKAATEQQQCPWWVQGAPTSRPPNREAPSTPQHYYATLR
eukprot:TRINITY_DN2112_c0_g1_i1.p1 TRINITY_DN2112_c0_g1~~TRINITY_DN2112_c0_g1_i1.p1  ORF type:complete len:534 (+),score=160.70 TRINITY_DN2112_c0_g1_i1:32-1603(+)